MSEYLTPKDVAKMLKVSQTTASTIMRKAGAIDVGGGARNQLLRIAEGDFERYLQTRAAPPPEPMPPQSVVLGKKRKTSKATKIEAPQGRRLPWNG